MIADPEGPSLHLLLSCVQLYGPTALVTHDPQRKFEFRTPLAVGALAVSGTTGRRMGGKCGTLPGLFSG